MQDNAIETRRFEMPDQCLDMKERGRISIARLAGLVPDATHGLLHSGKLVARMIGTGIETHISTGDFFEIPPGHDAYVESSDRVELIPFAPPEHQH